MQKVKKEWHCGNLWKVNGSFAITGQISGRMEIFDFPEKKKKEKRRKAYHGSFQPNLIIFWRNFVYF